MTKRVKTTVIKGAKGQPQTPPPPPEKPPQLEIRLNVRKTLGGDLMIFDHEDIDIAIMTADNKIVAFPKENFNDEVYSAQERLFKYLGKRGIIDPNSIQGGSVFMSMEAFMPQTEEHNLVQMALLNLYKFVEDERPSFLTRKAYEEEEERRLTEPGPEDSTEFDPKKYHDTQKGSIRAAMRPYGIGSIYRI
tara:strand:- start:1995 stop:2567 length:573 start_codon:yes stop_codon:yes gene_type:complete